MFCYGSLCLVSREPQACQECSCSPGFWTSASYIWDKFHPQWKYPWPYPRYTVGAIFLSKRRLVQQFMCYPTFKINSSMPAISDMVKESHSDSPDVRGAGLLWVSVIPRNSEYVHQMPSFGEGNHCCRSVTASALAYVSSDTSLITETTLSFTLWIFSRSLPFISTVKHLLVFEIISSPSKITSDSLTWKRNFP